MFTGVLTVYVLHETELSPSELLGQVLNGNKYTVFFWLFGISTKKEWEKMYPLLNFLNIKKNGACV